MRPCVCVCVHGACACACEVRLLFSIQICTVCFLLSLKVYCETSRLHHFACWQFVVCTVHKLNECNIV